MVLVDALVPFVGQPLVAYDIILPIDQQQIHGVRRRDGRTVRQLLDSRQSNRAGSFYELITAVTANDGCDGFRLVGDNRHHNVLLKLPKKCWIDFLCEVISRQSMERLFHVERHSVPPACLGNFRKPFRLDQFSVP